ncbi:cilia- and flagella-associated protein 53 [Zootoca vivipara]|uniref:cilia- and flagella-associated protein 53 n=1 Tax=Zootoca vivipara TaxID=8524 RepID=UPI00293BC004|nr:cilia- and flagella-associated protein 53 [Zootoca vivipara]
MEGDRMANPYSKVSRVVQGPKPFSYAIRAKFPKPNDAMKQILLWREQEKLRHAAAMYAKSHLLGRQIIEREDRNERKQFHRIVQKRVDVEMQGYLAGQEERKERLRDLLEAEEKCYLAAIESLGESMEDRRVNMRTKAKTLRDKREEARRKLVAEKRDQQFRATCEDARTLWSKKHLMEICEHRLAQLALKEELKKQEAREEATFAALWEEDRLAKEKRAAEEERKRARWTEGQKNLLNAQQTVVAAQREEARRLKEEEAKLMEEERQLMKLENERAEIERKRKLRECRDMLLDSMEEKKRRLHEEQQEELALDMKILDHIMKESEGETENQKRRKKELLKEQQMFKAYLAQQREDEQRQEKELDKLRAEETARFWAKRAARERAMKEARGRLLTEVMDTRRLQLEEKLQRNAQEQEALNRDRELLNEAILEFNRLEEEKYARRIQQAKVYQGELNAQMDYKKQARDLEKEEERRQYALSLEAERLYQQKIADIIARPYMKLSDLHPLQRYLASSS